ncbi:putative Tetracenomycin C resistance and export protein [Streptomyces viridochromogenes Tue57]|uniref:Putative Tetracenomycin C resistance and export protein n=1 Tax=Streptomyces viridochromogenes Tue57 TaxID=1160705 RepID=L8P5S0_STRVR|nr:putative Tetracenomycin C resistance and export protein [Streptomyces viridochromogenes Tue57]
MPAQSLGRRRVRRSSWCPAPRPRRFDGGLTSHAFEANDSL